MDRVLITGATGFVGSHLIEHLLSEDDLEVYGTKRRRSDTDHVQHVEDQVIWAETDITDSHSVRTTVAEVEPDAIFHLAAQSFVPTSWRAPQETFQTNAIGTVNLLEGLRVADVDARVQLAGSSEEYGLVKPDEVPITEDNPLRPQSPYGVSKVSADLFAQQYHSSYGIETVVTRGFNHTGPRRGETFVVSDWSKQIAEIELGRRDPVIEVGNLEPKRDFSDVRDIVRGYRLAVEACEAGEVYNICSEEAVSIKEILDMLLSSTEEEIDVEQDPAKLRPSDVPLLLGDCSKFREETGWEREIPFEQTLQDTLDYWRERLAG